MIANFLARGAMKISTPLRCLVRSMPSRVKWRSAAFTASVTFRLETKTRISPVVRASAWRMVSTIRFSSSWEMKSEVFMIGFTIRPQLHRRPCDRHRL